MSDLVLTSSNLFNPGKSDYEHTPLLLGDEAPGLCDSINKNFPEIWKTYKNMKSLDWDENEFPFTSCNVEFKTCPRATYEMMIRTLAWQWEADSLASRAVAPIMACFNPNSELWAAYSAIGTNEILHALTYSEIVRSSFDNPKTVLAEIMEVQAALQRMDSIAKVMKHAYTVAHKYALGMVDNDQETFNAMYLMIVAMFLLERGQFASSFAVTFAVADSGLFVPIGKAVQKIAQDELEVHAELGRVVLNHLHTTKRGQLAQQQCKQLVTQMFTDVGASEIGWNGNLFSEGRELVGVNNQLMNQWSLFNLGDCLPTLGITNPLEQEIPAKNPLRFMEDWLDIAKTQAAPQEQSNGQYKLNVMTRTDEGKTYDVDF